VRPGLSLGRAKRRDAFSPEQSTKLKAWYRLQASNQSGGEWTDWVDVKNSNPGAINAARRPAVTAAANGLPTATFATNDCVAIPLIGANYSTTAFGFGFWMNPAAYSSAQSVVVVGNGTGGASVRAFEFEIVSSPGRSMKVNVFDSGGAVKTGTCAVNTFPVAGTPVWTRVFYNSLGAADADKLKIYADSAAAAITFTGAGTHLLRSATGNLLVGNYNNGVASQPFGGVIGPDIYFWDADLTSDEDIAFKNYARPT